MTDPQSHIFKGEAGHRQASFWRPEWGGGSYNVRDACLCFSPPSSTPETQRHGHLRNEEKSQRLIQFHWNPNTTLIPDNGRTAGPILATDTETAKLDGPSVLFRSGLRVFLWQQLQFVPSSGTSALRLKIRSHLRHRHASRGPALPDWPGQIPKFLTNKL